MTEFYYRYVDFLEGSGGFDMSGEWEPGPSVVRVRIEPFEVVKRTPKGAWIIDDMGERRLILDHWFNKFANPTLEGARHDFIARKKKLIAIQEARIRDAKLAIATAEKNVKEPNVLEGLPTRLKRVYSWELEVNGMTARYIGQTFKGYLPWKPGVRELVVTDRRVPRDGEYMATANGVVQRIGAFLSKAEAERTYWIVEEVKE